MIANERINIASEQEAQRKMLPLSYHVLSVLHVKATFATRPFFCATQQLDDGVYHNLR